jgi:hypothetical protein
LFLWRGFAALGARFPLLAPLHAHAALLALASCHNTPSLIKIDLFFNFSLLLRMATFARGVSRQSESINLKQFPEESNIFPCRKTEKTPTDELSPADVLYFYFIRWA